MTDEKTGGPAFPQQDDAIGSAGMTLRDYFAAKASEDDIKFWMPKGFTETIIQRDHNGRCYETQQAASWTREQARYLYADAMLKARLK